MFVYLDDILMFLRQRKNVWHICQVLQWVLQQQLFVKPEKCIFHQTIVFLGFIDSLRQIEMEPEKLLELDSAL